LRLTTNTVTWWYYFLYHNQEQIKNILEGIAVFFGPDYGCPKDPRFRGEGKRRGVKAMTFVVTDVCIKCKYTDCVEVCPVDCFYEGENMLVIHPDECIDCGVCEPECPVEAIVPDTDERADKWLELNRKYSEEWPGLTQSREHDPEAKKHEEEEGKFEKYFSPNAGEGD